MDLKPATRHNGVIIFLIRDGKICLARKKRKIGVGLLNGYGGSIEGEETAPEAARRELRDECGVEVELEDFMHAGTVTFHNTLADGTTCIVKCEVFFVEKFSGEPKESEEMGPPAWFPTTDIPYAHMMAADPGWIPALITGHRATIEIFYGPGQTTLAKAIEITPRNDPAFWKFEPRKI